MSSGSDDLQNRSDVRTNPSIQDESPLSSSSSEVVGEVNQASPASCLSTPSASMREVSPTIPLKKVGGRKRTDAGVPEMRGLLDKRDAPVARALDEELRRSVTEAAPGPEERANDPPEGFIAIYEPAMQQGLRLPMHPFFREILKDWNLAPSQIIPNGWGQMVASFLLWIVAEAGENLTPREFESIYRPCRSSGWYNVSPRSGQKWRTATDSPNKLHNWKERFFFVGGDWEFIPEDLHPHVSIRRQFGELDCGKPPILKRNQGELRSKWDKVRALSSKFMSLNNLLKDDNLLASCGPMGKKVVEGTEEAPSPKRKAPAATEGLMRDAHKARRTEEGCRSSPSLDREPEGAKNYACSAGQNCRICISERHEELPASVIEMLPVCPSIVAASVHRYWTSSWEKVVKEVTVLERLQLAEVNLVRGLVLAKHIFSAFASFNAEDSKSKKLAKDLKVMGLEKVQLESDKRALHFKLDLVVLKETDMKAKYEIELKATKECLKQTRDQRRAAEASQKRAEEAQKLAEDQTLAAETALAAANSSLEAAAADIERSLTATSLS
ncbi:Uncharacterized protein Adt_31491 [Abeliophyllum distichum]|uniref:Transposase (putative) gypsy type domain-containing protein n=1 Tax=Abeliophyllum distichum TaxID=126358 RepID=A0ABD1RE96_9LAMI